MCTYCFNGADGLVCNMQDDCTEVIGQVLQCSNSFPALVTEKILDIYKGIRTVGGFYNDAVKRLMIGLMMLALSP